MRTQSPDTDLQAERLHIALLRQASSARRLFCARSLSQNIIWLGQRALARIHPDLTEPEIAALFAARHYGGFAKPVPQRATVREHPISEPNILNALKPVIEAFERLGATYWGC